jgi:hypothetical protein
VRVITLITGGITTNFLDNMQTEPLKLPENSYYGAIKDDIQAQEEDVPFGVPPEKFAQDVLKQVERGSTGKFWVGGAAWMSRVMLWFMNEWAVVSRCLLVMGLCSLLTEHAGPLFSVDETVHEEACWDT